MGSSLDQNGICETTKPLSNQLRVIREALKRSKIGMSHNVQIFNLLCRMRRCTLFASVGATIVLFGTFNTDGEAQTMQFLRADSGASIACLDYYAGPVGVPTEYGIEYQGDLRIRRCAAYSLALLELPGMRGRLTHDIFARVALAPCGVSDTPSFRFHRISPNRAHAMVQIPGTEKTRLELGSSISVTISAKPNLAAGLCSSVSVSPALSSR